MGNLATRLLALSVGVLLLAGAAPAWAHDFDLSDDMDCVGPTCLGSAEHEEADPFKGWLNLTVTNTGTEPWGDFHFELFQVTGSIENVFFDVASPNQPTSSQSGLSWVVSGGGHVLDLYFYGDPVLATETATFSVYTDNTTDQVTFFGTSYYPTPIPEPGTLLLFGLGAAGLGVLGRRARKL